MSQILVVEDDEAIRSLVSEVLRDDGYSVSEASNGVEALQEIGRARPDAIVLDLMMPVMDGWSFAEACHKLTSPAEIPIVVVSAAHGLADAAKRLRPYGVCAALPKPFDLDVLTATIARLAEPGRAPVPWPA